MNDKSHKPEAFAPAKGLKRVLNAYKWSMQGFRSTLRHEEAFRQELMLFVLLTPIGLYLGDNGIERALMVGSLVIVLIVEVLNSAIESVVDRIGHDPHPLSGRAKDQGSAAVFLSLMLVVLVWGFVLFG